MFKKGVVNKSLALFLALAMATTNMPADIIGSVTGNEAVAELSDVSAASSDYGLADNIQDGTILHCFDWKYSDIKAELPNIAEAGFTSIQTSPAQRDDSFGVWYMLYQPQTFSIYTNALGSKADLQSLCDEAEKYGINVVVDVVANHTRSIGDDGLDSSCYHNDGDAWYSDRYGITHGRIGMPDLNSESTTVQNKVKGYIEELKSVGVDGIRWDAAKHIGLPSEGCQFWPAVTSVGIYNYGEILVGPLESGGESLMVEYTNYMSVTDSKYGQAIREAFEHGGIPTSIGNWSERGVKKNKLVYWGESHDTYSNNGEYGEATQKIDQNKIDRAYAIVAAQGQSTALYFSRPHSTDKHSIMAGAKGSTHFTSPEVAAVNHLHNACVGEKDYYVNDQGQNAAAVCRESGAVVVKGSGSGQVTIANGGGTTAPGTYTDEITGNTWTVTSTTISGTVGDSGIAVFYNGGITDKASVGVSGSDSFMTNTTTVKLSAKNVTNAKYETSEGASGSYKDGDTITIGASTAEGSTIKVTVTGTGEDGSTVTESKTFTKKKNVIDGSYDIYFTKPSGWASSINCYAYVNETTNNAKWPGAAMKDLGDGIYAYNLPAGWTTAQIIFNDGNNQDPGSQQPGVEYTKGTSVLYENGKFTKVEVQQPTGTVTVKYVDGNGKEIATSKTLTGTVGDSYTTTEVTVDGYTLKTTPSNAKGTYTKDAITVTYVYEEVVDNTPKVTSSLADGSTFSTETETITLTLKNAESGTYSVDNGPVKSFTGTANVVIGQGKIADSTVTVKATATSGSETKNFTFTYNKKFSGTVDETVLQESVNVLVNVANAASAALASQYKTNPSGTGKSATITIDGSFSDWSEDMLIAQGAAWDVANHYKGGHENCVLDTYSLYAAWDDTNLYVGWQMVNTTDTWARSGDGPLSDGGRVLDVPLILALSIDENSTSMSNKNTTGGSIWGQKMGLTFTTHVDRLFYMSGKPGLGKPSMFKAVDAQGNTDYEEGSVGFADGGIEYKMAEGNIASSIIGLNDSSDPSDVSSDSADWVDYKTFTGSAGSHNTTYDSFYEIKIPLATLGIDKSYIENNGIGAMLVATRGESALDCIPFDTTMLDNATGDYTSDPSTSAEKDDIDNITVPLARIGKSGGTITPPTLTPTPTTPATPTPTPIPDKLELNFGADRCAPQEAGTALTLKGIAQGGTAPYSYSISVDDVAVDSTSKNDEATASWTATAGEHVIKCVVTDAKGNTATSAKYYTVEGDVIPCTHPSTQLVDAVAATCEEAGYTGDKVCTECNEKVENGTIIPALGHKWGEWVVKTPATTETEGVKTRTCATCEKVETSSIPKLEDTGCKHENTEVRDKVEATCGADGYTGNTYCKDCKAVLAVGTTIPKTDKHAWNEGTVTKQPSTTEEGERTFRCTVCGEEKTEVIEKLPVTQCKHINVETINATAAKCAEAGYTGDTHCLDCDTIIEYGSVIPALGKHSYDNGKVSKEPTATETGVRTYTCSVCGDTYEESIPALGVVACKHVNVTKKNQKNATCTETGYTGDTICADCGAFISAGEGIEALGHSWDNGAITKQPTATESGIRTYTCRNCGEKDEVSIPATGCQHENTILKNQKKSTCGETGYTGDVYCADCNKLLIGGMSIAALGHSWDTGVVAKEPTRTEAGTKVYTCSRCQDTRTEVIPATGVCAHNYVTINQKDATCTQAGFTGDLWCSLCGDVLHVGQTISALGHSWNEGVVTLAPTATTTGIKTFTCTRCTATVQEILPATGVIDGGANNGNAGDADDTDDTDDTAGTTVEAGDSIVDNTTNATFRVTSTKSKTVEYTVAGNKSSVVVVPQTVTVNGEAYKVTSIASNAFKNDKTITSVTIGSNIKTIGDSAFKNCTNLTKVVIGKNVTKISANAFYGCKKLTTVSIPSKVTTIGTKAFYNCTSLKSVVMPSKLTTIGASAFYKCTKLTSIRIPANVKSIGSKAFYGCKNLKKITIKTTKLTSKKVGSSAFKGIYSKATIKIPSKKAASYKKILKSKGVKSTAKFMV